MFMRYRHEGWAAGFIEKLCREEEGIMRAENAVNRISRSYLRAVRQMYDERARLDHGQDIYDARQKGLAEGQTEKSLEIARKMKGIGLPVTQISEVTGLLPEVIDKL